MTGLTIKDAPKLPPNLEREVGDDYVVGIRKAHVGSYPKIYYGIEGDVYIKHFTGEEKTIKRWSPTLRNPFKKVPKTLRKKDIDFRVSDISLTHKDFIEDLKIVIACKYDKVIQNGVLEDWFKPIIEPYKDYVKQVKGT